jgi:hypothetical protein
VRAGAERAGGGLDHELRQVAAAGWVVGRADAQPAGDLPRAAVQSTALARVVGHVLLGPLADARRSLQLRARRQVLGALVERQLDRAAGGLALVHAAGEQRDEPVDRLLGGLGRERERDPQQLGRDPTRCGFCQRGLTTRELSM